MAMYTYSTAMDHTRNFILFRCIKYVSGSVNINIEVNGVCMLSLTEQGRNMEYVKAAKALGVGNLTIMYRHLLPNGMTPVITFLPFRMSGAILALTSLDFLGLGVPPSTPSLGELLAQGKANIDAWWLSLSTFFILVGTLVLLIFIGEALREAFDPRKQ